MTQIFSLFAHLFAWFFVIGVLVASTREYEREVGYIQRVAQEERRLLICAQLLANKENIRDAAQFLQRDFPKEQGIARAAAELESELSQVEKTQLCEQGSFLNLRPDRHKVVRSDLDPLWPNWSGVLAASLARP